MRLTKLEINGFKSFAKKTELDFEPGVTAVVGPNGCGKSNISDAVRWVLGEQSARALRGAKMEDVIFNGTEQRKPLSFCEVSLSFDNSDGKLPTEYTDVTVSRRVYRSGDGEYLLNGTVCRLKDIQELLRDTGIGREGYSIIGQGRVEEILANKSGDRRAAFEEAAGVMRYRVRKEEAERKLEHTRKNLVRLEDILEELHAQLGPLEEQSASARRFLQLREELKDIEINLFLHQYDRLQGRLRALQGEMEQLEASTREEAEKEALLNAACAKAEAEAEAMNAAISEMQAQLLTLISGVESNSGEARVMQERMAHLRAEEARLQAQSEADIRAAGEAEAQRAALAAGTEEKEKELGACRERIAGTERALEELAAQTQAQEQLVETQKQSLIDAMNRISDAKSRSSRLSAIQDTLRERLGRIGGEEAAAREEESKLAAEYEEAEAYLDTLRREHAQREARRDEALRAHNEIQLRIREGEEKENEAGRAREAAAARIRVLEEMQKAHEGYYTSVRRLLADAAQIPTLQKRIIGVVAELLRVPKEYEVAVEMSLGSALQNIVTPDERDAKLVIEHLRAKQYGRATMLPVSAMRPRLLSREERGFCEGVQGVIGVASELVRYDAAYRNVFENLLGRTLLVEHLDAGIAVNKKARAAFRIATLEGDIINPGGSMTGGSVQKREFSLLGRGRELEELQGRLRKLEEKRRALRAQNEALQSSLAAASTRAEEAAEALHAGELKLATEREKTDIIRKYMEENAAQIQALLEERERLEENLADTERQQREAEEAQAGLEHGNAATQEDIRASQKALSEMRARLEEEREAATVRKVQAAGLEKELAAMRGEAGRMEREAKRCRADAERAAEAARGAQAQRLDMEAQMRGVDARIDEGRRDVDARKDQIQDMENERDAHAVSLREMRARREGLSAALSELRERAHRAELNASKAQMELAGIQDRIWEDYALTYENALPLRHEIAVTASHIRIDELKKDMRALGDVNVNAIEDYKNVRERFDMLGAQIEDLHKAEGDLEALIADLISTMERAFRKQFSIIQENFSQVFRELFGGGQAELLLTDKQDVLNCDIDIIAQPPGKKLQMLSLLSGGERALTAIALIFAILKLKPTAFCILDEIESALDEVNVANFAAYVKRYAADTQFILITHRKGSMEVSDCMYGVSMEERGISRVLSVKFSDFEKEAG